MFEVREPEAAATIAALQTSSSRIERVIDERTLSLTLESGKHVSVRLLGIVARNDRGASEYLAEEIVGCKARCEFDRRRLASDGAILAYVFAGERCVNEELLKRGLARYEAHPGDSSAWSRRLKQAAQGEAKPQR